MFLGIIRNLFKKRDLTEDDPGVNPRISKINDEIQLCKNCPFSGRCEWPGGCSSLKQIREKRMQLVNKYRGCTEDAGKTNAGVKTKQKLWYLVGIGWRIQLERNSYKTVRVLRVNEDTCEATVMTFDNGHEPNSKQEYTVKIPMLEDNRGNLFVDLREFKKAVRSSLSEWVVPRR